MEFAYKLKYIREQINISQEHHAKELGVSFATVNRWESGKFMPNYKALKALEDFYKKNAMGRNKMTEIGEKSLNGKMRVYFCVLNFSIKGENYGIN